jgi:multiple sugar transport system permease protein
MNPRNMGKGAHLVGLAALLVFTLFPFYWMVSSSLKDQTDLLASPPVWTFTPTLAHYAEIWQDDKVFGAIVERQSG